MVCRLVVPVYLRIFLAAEIFKYIFEIIQLIYMVVYIYAYTRRRTPQVTRVLYDKHMPHVLPQINYTKFRCFRNKSVFYKITLRVSTNNAS